MIHTISIHSDNGDFEVNDELRVRLHLTDDRWCVTLFVGETPFFSMGLDELNEFCETLQSIDK